MGKGSNARCCVDRIEWGYSDRPESLARCPLRSPVHRIFRDRVQPESVLLRPIQNSAERRHDILLDSIFGHTRHFKINEAQKHGVVRHWVPGQCGEQLDWCFSKALGGAQHCKRAGIRRPGDTSDISPGFPSVGDCRCQSVIDLEAICLALCNKSSIRGRYRFVLCACTCARWLLIRRR